MKKATLEFAICMAIFCYASSVSAGDSLGQLSSNPYAEKSTSGISANNYRINQSMNNKYT